MSEKDIESINYLLPDEDIYSGESIINAANKVFDYNKFATTTRNKKQKKLTAEKIKRKYKNLKKPKKTYLVDEKDIETIDYLLPSEDIYAGESIVKAANKVFNFDQFKREQAREILMYNEQLLNEMAEMINYVDDMDINDLKENKNLAIAAKKIKDKYRKMRRRHQQKLADAETINYVDDLNLNDLRENKDLLMTAKKIKNKYKKIRWQQQQKLADTKTINYVDDTSINDLNENKNLKIAAEKIKNKYKKIRQKRKAPVPIETLDKETEVFFLSLKSRKTDKRAIIAAKNKLK